MWVFPVCSLIVSLNTPMSGVVLVSSNQRQRTNTVGRNERTPQETRKTRLDLMCVRLRPPSDRMLVAIRLNGTLRTRLQWFASFLFIWF